MIPEVGQWYRHQVDEKFFEIVSVDKDTDTIEIQYQDGTVEELGFDGWESDEEDGNLELTTAPGLEEEDDEDEDDDYEDEDEEEEE